MLCRLHPTGNGMIRCLCSSIESIINAFGHGAAIEGERIPTIRGSGKDCSTHEILVERSAFCSRERIQTAALNHCDKSRYRDLEYSCAGTMATHWRPFLHGKIPLNCRNLCRKGEVERLLTPAKSDSAGCLDRILEALSITCAMIHQYWCSDPHILGRMTKEACAVVTKSAQVSNHACLCVHRREARVDKTRKSAHHMSMIRSIRLTTDAPRIPYSSDIQKGFMSKKEVSGEKGPRAKLIIRKQVFQGNVTTIGSEMDDTIDQIAATTPQRHEMACLTDTLQRYTPALTWLSLDFNGV